MDHFRRTRKEQPPVAVGVCEVLAVSDLAVKVRLPSRDEEWIPFSQIHDDSEIYESAADIGSEGKLVVTAWIAKQKNLG